MLLRFRVVEKFRGCSNASARTRQSKATLAWLLALPPIMLLWQSRVAVLATCTFEMLMSHCIPKMYS